MDPGPLLSLWATALATAGDTPSAAWLDFLTRGGLLGGALLIIWALLTDRLVSGARHREAIDARDREIELWRSVALRSSGSLERVADAFLPATAAR